MKKWMLGVLLVTCSIAHAQTPGLKAGLWETKIIHRIVDGKDMTLQMAASQAKMQAAMANMTPQQRAQMAGMMKSMPPGQNGTVRTCISAAMAAKQYAMVDPDGHCSAMSLTPIGNKVSFSFTCNQEGRTSTGSGERIFNGNSASTHLDMTSTDAGGQHKVQIDSEMNYLGSDCQGVQPIDEMMKSLQAQHQ